MTISTLGYCSTRNWTGKARAALILVALGAFMVAPAAANVMIPSTERQALVDLYNSTNGSSWTNKTNWLGAVGTECTWFGVTCNTTPKVTRVAMQSNNVTGSLPSSLSNLPELQTLDLGGNQITGTIPPALGSLANLEFLVLFNNLLDGSIPAELGNLSKLTYLFLGGNNLSGTIPSQLGNLTALNTLLIGRQKLSGPIPTTLANLTNITSGGLDIRFNALFSTSSSLTAFLNSRQISGDWQSTQTVAPVVSVQSATGDSVTLAWSPIAYQFVPGFYQAFHSTAPGGPYAPFPTTVPKTASSIKVTGLLPSTRYYFVVATTTPANHALSANRNTVVSGFSAEVSTLTESAALIVASVPTPLVQIAGDGSTTTTSYALTNVGSSASTITLTRSGDQGGEFFTQSPALFSISAGESQIVTITSTAQAVPTLLNGSSIPAGAGVPAGLRIPVQLFAHEAPGAGVRDVVAVDTRVDVSGPVGQNPTGQITFRNNGTAAATGVLSSDVPWIVPAPGIIRIEPGATSAPLTFTILRAQQPDATSPAGSITGTITFVYPSGSLGSVAKTPFDTPNPVSLAGLVVNDTRQTDITSAAIPLLGAGEVGFFIPGIGHVIGSGGKEFISDVSIVSSDSILGIPDLQLFFLSGTASLKADQALAPRQGLQLADAVTQYFKVPPPVQGTLHVRSKDSAKLTVSANVFNKSNPKGTYGTAIPVFRSNRAIGSGEKLVLTGLVKDATSRTNLYLQETSGAAGAARIEFFNAAGQLLSAIDSSVSPFAFSAVGSVVPDGGVMAIVTNTSGGKLQAYATPVDDASGDTWAVADWTRQYGLAGSEPVLIPVAGFVAGANGANFRTDVAVTNVGSASSRIALTYYPAGIMRSVELGPNQTRVIPNVTESFFQVSGTSVGSIIATPLNGGRFAVTSRTYTASAGDPATFGTGVPTLPVSSALRSGQSQLFGGLEDSTLRTQGARAGNTFRTNVGLVETAGEPVTVKVTVFFTDGRSLAGGAPNGSLTLTLAAHEFKQLNGIVRQVIGPSRDTRYGDLHNVQVKVEILSGSTGAVVPFVTLTDNGTNDTVLRTE